MLGLLDIAGVFAVIAFMGVPTCLAGALLREKSSSELLSPPISCQVEPKLTGFDCGGGKALEEAAVPEELG